MTFGPKGTYANVGLPGTGISYRTRVDGGAEKRRIEREQHRAQREIERLEAIERRRQALSNVKLGLMDNGAIQVRNAFDEDLTPADLRLMWEQKGSTVLEWLEEEARKINGDSDLLERIHEDTPSSNLEPEYSPDPFHVPKPQKPDRPTKHPKPQPQTLEPLGFFARMLPNKRKKHQEEMELLDLQYQASVRAWEKLTEEDEKRFARLLLKWEMEMKEWEERKRGHDCQEEQKRTEYPLRLREDLDLMEEILELALASLEWPRETLIDFTIEVGGTEVWLDVDLPEIEDFPDRSAVLAASGRKLNIKNKSQKQLRQEYARHIHGIGFRLAGTVFATLPACINAGISGYSQRINKATGVTSDEYLYSVLVTREGFSKIDFNALDKVDPIAALEAFELRRKMTSTGVFKPIEPFILQGKA